MQLDRKSLGEDHSVMKLRNKLIMERNQKTHLEPDDNQANQDFSQNQINNTSRKLRRFVQNRLIDADLGQAKRSESPKKESSNSFTINRSRITTDIQPLPNHYDHQGIMVNPQNINFPEVHRDNIISELNHLKTTEHLIPPTIKENNVVTSQGQHIVSLPSGDRIEVNNIIYKKIELIGKGGTSKVYRVKRLFKAETLQKMKKNGFQSTTTFALKIVDFDHFDESSIDFFKGEINILHKLKSKERVVKLVDYEMKTDHINLVMECGSYSLSDVLSNRKTLSFDSDFVKHHFKEICLCLKDVHDAEIIHADLKPANFVFVRGLLKIIDFGIADSIPDNTVNIYRDKQFGTPNYMAPEALVRLNNNDTNYTGSNFVYDYNSVENSEIFWKVGKPADIWSLGCILYQMVYGDPPFNHLQGAKRLKEIMDPNTAVICPQKDKNGTDIPKSLIKLIHECLNKASKKRPTIIDILYKSEFLNYENYLKANVASMLQHIIEQRDGTISKKDLMEMINKYDLL